MFVQRLSALAISLILFAACAGASFAQSIRLMSNDRYARFEGSITPSSADQLASFLFRYPQIVAIQLSSMGGDVRSAIRMAAAIHDRHLGTFVPVGDTCASACALLFFAGNDRLLMGRLGLHQLEDHGRGTASALQTILAQELDAFVRYGVPWPLIQRMLTTPPHEIYWLTPADIAQYGVNRDLPESVNEGANPEGIPTSPLDSAADGVPNVRPDQAPPRARRPPRFAEFPADRYEGAIHLPDFGGRDADFRSFRTRILSGAQQGPNFAGHYRIIEIGCGTSCRFAFLIDETTGRVANFPYGGETHYGMSLTYVTESRLMRVRWLSDIPGEICTARDIVFTDGQWDVLAEWTIPHSRFFCAP